MSSDETAAFIEATTLEDAGVRLEPLREDHAAGLGAAGAEQRLHELRWSWVPSLEDAALYVAHALATPDRVAYAVVSGGVVLGTTSYHDVRAGPRRVEIGATCYAVSHHRTALNTRCKRMLLAYAFDVVGCRTVGFRTDSENHCSRRAIERLGAHRDGIIRGDALRRDGSVRDTVRYSVTRAEWPSVRDRLEALLAGRPAPLRS